MRSLGRAERFVAGAVGAAGRRTFLLEVAGDGPVEWFLLEKQQVAALAERALRLLRDRGVPPGLPGPDLSAPGQPSFRVSEIALGSDDDDFVLILSPTGDPEAPDAPEPVGFTVAAELLDSMARRAVEAVGAGRPPCRFCGLPEDAEGHACPAGNGDLRDS